MLCVVVCVFMYVDIFFLDSFLLLLVLMCENMFVWGGGCWILNIFSLYVSVVFFEDRKLLLNIFNKVMVKIISK